MLGAMPVFAQVGQFDIPSEEASKSIPELARQADVQIIAPGEPLQSVVTPAVKGTFDVIAALQMMLRGTDFTVSRSAEGIITISSPDKGSDCDDRGETMTNQSKLFATASWLAMLAATVQCAVAQTNDNQNVETVVVTGIRASLQSALDIKKNSDQFVDSIVAQDIGKLPDNQVVDALQHVSGIQVQHGNGTGENDQIWIRGLPDVATLLNGREIFTTTGRFITLADIPAELLQRLDVHKSTQATDLEGGLAGLVDVRLHRPFDFDGMQVAASLQGRYGTVSGHVDPIASALFSNRWQTSSGEWGLLADVSYNKSHWQDEDAFDYYSNATVSNASGSAHSPGTLGGIQYPGSRERASANVSAQWRPNDNTEVFAEFFYTRYRDKYEVNFLIGLPGNNNPVTDFTTVTDPNGLLEMKTVSECCFVLTSNQGFHDSTDTYQFATGANWTSGNLQLSTEADYTDSKYKRRGFIVDTALFVETEYDSNYQNGGTPFMGSNDLSYWMTSSNYHPTQLFDQWTKQSGNEFDWRGDATFTINDELKSIQVGVRYANRYGKNDQDWGGAISCYGGTDQMGADPALVASAACNGGAWWANSVDTIFPGMMTKNHGPFFEGETGWGVRNWMNAGSDWMFSHVSDLRTAFGQPTSDPAAILSNSFADREESFSGYLMANYDVNVDGMPLNGNIGVRIVDTLSKMDAYDTQVTPGNPTTYTPTQSSKEDTAIMPSLNAKLGLTDNLFLRLGIGRTVTRPTFAQLDPGLYLSASGLTFNNNGSAGNPDLHPIKATNVDLGAEYYFGRANAVTGTLFYRQIDGYVQSIIRTETYGGLDYAITRPVNSGVGFLQGAELAYTQWADFLPDIWNGLGIQLNSTFVEGHFTDITSIGGKHPYAGVSKWAFNIIPMFEYGPVTVRASYSWRSSYQVGYTFADAASTNPATVWTKPYGELGLSASYNVTDQLVATFDMSNVLDSKYQDTFGQGAFATIYPRDTRHYDQVYQVGLRFKM